MQIQKPSHNSRPVRTSLGVRVSPELLKRTPFITSAKFFFALITILLGLAFVICRHRVDIPVSLKTPLLTAVCILLGFMYAHITELQHEILHGHAFASNFINRFLGFFCGLFMLSSYSHYRRQHLLHHRYLGTPQNTEFFTYPSTGLNSPFKLLYAAFDWSRFCRVGRLMFNGLLNIPVKELMGDTSAIESSQEYAVYAVIVISVLGYTLSSGDMCFVYAWVMPLLLISEPVHYLMELPEHFGLDADGDPNIVASTRTIESNWFMWWYTNGNNLHTAHHLHGRVPMTKTRKLDSVVKRKYLVVEQSYFDFYRKVIRGELVPFEYKCGTKAAADNR